MDDMELLNQPAAEATPATIAAPAETPAPPDLDPLAEAAAVPDAPSDAPDAAAAEDDPESASQGEAIEIEYPDDEGAAPEGDEAAVTEPSSPEPEPDRPALKYSTAALTKLLKENQPLAQAIEANPRAKSQLYQMARRSQELGQYQELVPSLARAREAVQAADQLQQLDSVYFGQDPQQFWRSLYDAQTQPDPVSGHARSSGVYERNVQFLHKAFLDRMEQQAIRENNGDLSGAVRSFRDALGWNSQSSPAKEGGKPAVGGAGEEPGLPSHIRQKLEQADANARELEQLRLRRSEEGQRQSEAFLDETAAEVAGELRAFVDGLLANAKLSDYDKRNIGRDFIESVSQLADQDKVQAAALEEILRAGGNTPQTRAKMVSRAKAWARQNGRDILEPILARRGAGLKQRQLHREAAQARRRPEPSAVGAPALPRQLNAREMVRSAEKQLGRRMTDREILELA